MPEPTRRWCNRCGATTRHWRERAPTIRDPRFVIFSLLIWAGWVLAVPWCCEACGGESRPWTRRRD